MLYLLNLPIDCQLGIFFQYFVGILVMCEVITNAIKVWFDLKIFLFIFKEGERALKWIKVRQSGFSSIQNRN